MSSKNENETGLRINSNESVMNLFYSALMNINKKCSIKLFVWKPVLIRSFIQLENRFSPLDTSAGALTNRHLWG